MGRVVALDLGDRRIGIAATDPLQLTAQGLETLEVTSPAQAIECVAARCQALEAETILVGVPKNMDGSVGERAAAALDFAERLRERVNAEIVTWDERWTSRQARRTLREAGVRTRGRKGLVDRTAATLMLSEYLSFRGGQGRER